MKIIQAKDLNEFNPDLIIDARSPSEYLHSHIPNAKNFYALSDEEHHEVGTIYKDKKSKAKILGASYICKNASEHIKSIDSLVSMGSKISIYCARGGQRSSSLGVILSQIGYRVAKIENGYKGYRNFVLEYLENFENLEFIVLHGNTGSGKTELIQELSPSIDLEGLANHFGSTFGSVKGEQPSTKSFQNNLAHQMMSLKEKYCFIEGESKKIGKLSLSNRLYKKMQDGIKVWIQTPMEIRVKQILKDYENIDDEFFYASMEKISPYIKKSVKDEILLAYKKSDLTQVSYLLLHDYYDKIYKKPKHIDFNIEFKDKSSTLKQLNDIKKGLYEK